MLNKARIKINNYYSKNYPGILTTTSDNTGQKYKKMRIKRHFNDIYKKTPL
jgi:hypothetical protein